MQTIRVIISLCFRGFRVWIEPLHHLLSHTYRNNEAIVATVHQQSRILFFPSHINNKLHSPAFSLFPVQNVIIVSTRQKTNPSIGILIYKLLY